MDGDAASILHDTGAGMMIDFYDESGLKEAILNLFQKFLKGTLSIKGSSHSNYSRKALTKELTGLMDATMPDEG